MGVRVSAPGVKPREQWDREDYLDFLDGWHEESGLGLVSQRDRQRTVRYEVLPEGDAIKNLLDDFFSPMSEPVEPEYRTHLSGLLFDLGRDHRVAHRQATGI